MRKTAIIGLLVGTFGPLTVLVLGRVMSFATTTGWQLAGAVCAVAGRVIVCVADPLNWRARLGRMVSLVVVMVGGALASALAWVLLGAWMKDLPATALVVDYEMRPPPTEVTEKIAVFPVRPDTEAGMTWTSGHYTIQYDESRGPTIVYYCTVTNKGNASLLGLIWRISPSFSNGA
jgi:hypothetical protein